MKLFKQSIVKAFAHVPTPGQEVLIEKLAAFVLDQNQLQCFILQGYAGTGKTTVVSALINALPNIQKKHVLLAPTGRAAKVIAGYSGQKAYTLHKHLYISGLGEVGIQLALRENKARNTLFIVDEASMIPCENISQERNLLYDLFQFVYNGKGCKLLLLGDEAQLPPVHVAESPVFNMEFLRASFALEVIQHKLTEVVRQTEWSGILYNATLLREKIRKDNSSLPFFTHGFTDVKQVEGADLEDLLNTVYNAYGMENTVVICRSNKEANMFNKEIRNRILFRDNELSAGDVLMVVRNNYFWLASSSKSGFIANGDMVEVLKVKRVEDRYGFRFADVVVRMVDFTDEKELEVKLLLDTLYAETPSLSVVQLKALYAAVAEDYLHVTNKRMRAVQVRQDPFLNALQVKFSYALTCHKTQGGQWDAVIVSRGYLTTDMIDKEYLRWLYTAITRTQKKLWLLNFDERFWSPSLEQ